MPFKPPYNKKITSFDLIYGLSIARKYYIATYKNFKLAENQGNIKYINMYPVTQYEKQQTKKNLPLPPNYKSFIEALNSHPKYKEAHLSKFYPISMYSNKEGLYQCDIELPKNIRRKSKGGLHWAAQSSEKENRFNIHFLLDDICFKEVVTKSNLKDIEFSDFKSFVSHWLKDKKDFELNKIRSSPLGSIKDRAITNAELRWIYRNRFDSKVQKVIQFWYKGMPCCPPWEPQFDKNQNGVSISKLWLIYKPTHIPFYETDHVSTLRKISRISRLIKFCR